MDQYFFKIVDNIDFVWKVGTNNKDPYKLNEIDFGHFVCNQRQFVPYLFHNIQDIKNSELFDGYREIRPHSLTDDKYYLDTTIGLLHKDDYWQTLFAVRYIKCLEKISPVVFGQAIEAIDQLIFTKLMACDYTIGQKIHETAYTYFQSLWEIDEYFSSTNLDTIDKFLETLQLQALYIRRDDDENTVLIHFRPSWDEEHGLSIALNIESMEVTLAN